MGPTEFEPPHGGFGQSCRLPNELCRIVVSHVAADFDYVPSRKTLIALSRSGEPFTSLAEEFLYSDPGDLDTIGKQVLFLCSLKSKPSRTSLVRSLRLFWDSKGANTQQLIMITDACPNVKSLLVQVGEDLSDQNRISSDHIEGLCVMLSGCRCIKSIHFSTMLSWVPEDEHVDLFLERGDQLRNLISNSPRVEKSVKQLESVVVTGQSDWLIHGLSPHFSPKLTTLRLSQDCSMGASETPFTDLSRQCPNLKSLSIRQTLATSEDLEEACKAWGDSLERLEIASIEDIRDWVSPMLPAMKVLKALNLGSGCCIRAQEIKAIALATSPLEEIDLGDIYLSAGGDVDEVDQALQSMIDAHSPTLRILKLWGTDVGWPVMQSCKKARSLHTINLVLSYSPQASEVDDLLDACAGLDNFPGWFKDYSARWSEWEARRKIRGEAQQEELRRDPTICGLGT